MRCHYIVHISNSFNRTRKCINLCKPQIVGPTMPLPTWRRKNNLSRSIYFSINWIHYSCDIKTLSRCSEWLAGWLWIYLPQMEGCIVCPWVVAHWTVYLCTHINSHTNIAYFNLPCREGTCSRGWPHSIRGSWGRKWWLRMRSAHTPIDRSLQARWIAIRG